jgi:hypothetical protein
MGLAGLSEPVVHEFPIVHCANRQRDLEEARLLIGMEGKEPYIL